MLERGHAEFRESPFYEVGRISQGWSDLAGCGTRIELRASLAALRVTPEGHEERRRREETAVGRVSGFFAYAMLAVLGGAVTYKAAQRSRRDKFVSTPVAISGLAACAIAVVFTVLCFATLVN